MASLAINITFIPQANQRYATCGDWQFGPNGALQIKISQMSDRRSEIAVAVHELIEAVMCQMNGVAGADVDAWDMAHLNYDEPGELPGSPYLLEHQSATDVEKAVLAVLGLGWDEHEAIVDALFPSPSDPDNPHMR